LILSLVLGSLVLLQIGKAQTLPAIKLEPKYVAAKVGEKFDVQIKVYGATFPNSEVHAWQVHIEFPIAALEAMPSPAYGPFMSAPRIGYWGVLLYNAPAGQNVVNVTEGSRFIAGQQVLIKDNLNSENKTISSITGSMITLSSNLVNSYTIANNAGAYPYPTLSAIGSISNSLGTGTFGQTTQGVNPGAQGDGLLATLTFYVEQDVSSRLNITGTLTYIKTTLGEVVGDDLGELEKQDAYIIQSGDINADGIVSGNDLFSLGRDFNKCPIQTRSPTATSSPGTAWTSPTNAYKPDNLAASAATPAGKIQDYYTFGFPTTVWTGVGKVEVGLFARIGTGGDDQIKIEVSNNGGASWSATTGTVSPTTTATWTMYWVDLTAAYAWAPAGVANMRVRITSVMVGGVMATVYVDWVAVRVTPTPTSSSGYSDVNRNGIVNGADLTSLAGQFGQRYGT
jgi:hypothetical protein